MNKSLVSFNKASLAMDGSLRCCAKPSIAWTWPGFRLPRPTFAGRWPKFSWTPFKILTGCAAMTAMLTIFALQQLPREARIVVEKPRIVLQADTDAPREAARTPDPALEPVIRIIQTTKVAATAATAEPTPKHPDITPLTPVTVPPIIITQEEDDRPSRRSRRHHDDVCQRHGLRRVEAHGGRSWRCR
jgi:hypothetical protein